MRTYLILYALFLFLMNSVIAPKTRMQARIKKGRAMSILDINQVKICDNMEMSIGLHSITFQEGIFT